MPVNFQPTPYYGSPQPGQTQNLEGQAQAMGLSGMSAFGTLPDPQLTAQALQTNQGYTAANLISQSSPEFASILGNSIAGQAVTTAQQTTQNLIPGWTQNPTMNKQDWAGYWQSFHNSDAGKQWASFGEMPIANVSYANMVRNGSKQEVSKWQTLLNQRGFLGKGETSGVWDSSTETAFRSFMISTYLPEALYSKDDNTRAQDALFLQSLGVDVNSIASSQGHDASFQSQLIDNWLQTRGPNVNMRDSISQYANEFGESTVPQNILALRGGFLSTVTDGLSSILHVPGDILGIIPGIGGGAKAAADAIVNPVDELLSGNLLTHPGQIEESSTQAHAENAAANLTGAEQQALAPVIQDIHNSTGFLGAFDAWNTFKNRILLSGAFWLEDAVKGKIENPFDSHSDVFTRAEQNENNVAQGLFGQNFVKDHPTLGNLLNLTINMVDDPSSWIIPNLGEIGLLSKLDEAGTEATTVEKISGGLISHRSGTIRLSSVGPKSILAAMKQGTVKGLADAISHPFETAQAEVSSFLYNGLKSGDLNGLEVSKALGGLSDKDLQTILTRLKSAKSVDEVQNMLRTTFPFADKYQDVSYLANRREFLNTMRPENLKGVMPEKIQRVLYQMSGMDNHGAMNMNDIHGTAERVQTSLETVFHKGLTDDPAKAEKYRMKINDVVNKIVEAPTPKDRIKAVNLGKNLWKEMFTSNPDLIKQFAKGATGDAANEKILKAFDDWGTLGAVAKKEDTQTLNAVDGSALEQSSEEMSKKYGTKIAALQKSDPEEAARLQTLLDEGYHSVATAITAMYNKPALAEHDTAHIPPLKTAIDDILADMDQKLGAESAPFTKAQEEQWIGWEYSPYAAVAFQHPVLRKVDAIQRKYWVDRAMSNWKQAVLLKPSSGLKIAGGDEAIRGFVDLMSHDPKQAAKYLFDVIRRKAVGPLPKSLQTDLGQLTHNQQVNYFDGIMPGDPEYVDRLVHTFNDILPESGHSTEWANLMTKQMSKKSGKIDNQAIFNGIKKWLTGGSEEAKAHLTRHKLDASSDDQVTLAAHKINNYYTSLIGPVKRGGETPTLLQGLLDGKLNPKDVQKILDDRKGDSSLYLPQIAGRVASNPANSFSGMLGKLSDNWHHNYTQSWVNKARARVYYNKMDSETAKMKRWYNGSNNRERQSVSDDDIREEAASRAAHWTKRNTYQMNKTVFGQAARTVFPFWGATANMDRFWLRAIRQNPSIAAPVLELADYATNQAQNNQTEFSLPGSGKILQMLGFNNGDDISFNPMSAMFLTSEGVNGFVPGLGPVVTAGIKQAAQINPDFGTDLANSQLGQLMGLGYINSESPALPWLEKIVDGASMAMGGGAPLQGVPLIGTSADYYTKQINEKLQQEEGLALEKQGPNPTVQSATEDVGKQTMLSGVGKFLPGGAAATVPKEQEIQSALKLWDGATTEADRQAIIQQYPDIAPYLQYIDPNTSDNEKSTLLAQSPWIQPYTIGQSESVGTDVAQAEPSAQQYEEDVDSGRVEILSPGDYLQKIQTSQQNNQAWAIYDNIQTQWQNYLNATGQSATSLTAETWKSANIDPVINNLSSLYPAWGQTFAKENSSTQEGLYEASLPLSSVASFETIPQNVALETPTTNMWRAAMQFIQQAQLSIRQIMVDNGTKVEQNQIMAGLQTQLQQLTQTAPNSEFAAQLGRYRFSKVSDLVTFGAESGGTL